MTFSLYTTPFPYLDSHLYNLSLFKLHRGNNLTSVRMWCVDYCQPLVRRHYILALLPSVNVNYIGH